MDQITSNLRNPWGISGGVNPQRTDLWQVNLTDAIASINDQIHPPLQAVSSYFISTITLPELKVRAEPIRRDSQIYNMPSWDEPLDPVRITFIMDDGPTKKNLEALGQSQVYRFLNAWRRLVRAGRGSVGSEPSILLDDQYKIKFRFTIEAILLRGYPALPVSIQSQKQSSISKPNNSTMDATFNTPVTGTPDASWGAQYRSPANTKANFAGLGITNTLWLENAWLAGFKIGDMTYEGAKVLTIEANFYAENIHSLNEPKPVNNAE